MLPLDISSELGKAGGYLVFFLIGSGFGVALELAGFGDSRRLAAQFYFKDMTVLKTMFTGIIVACITLGPLFYFLGGRSFARSQAAKQPAGLASTTGAMGPSRSQAGKRC